MANRAQVKKGGSTPSRTTTKSGVKHREEPKTKKPVFGVKNQRWISKTGGRTFTCRNPFPISYKDPETGKIINDTVIYGEGNPSIWMSEMTGMKNINRDALVFINKVYIASLDEALLQEYFWTITNLGGYTEIYLEDKEAEAEIELEKFELQDRNDEIIKKASFAYKKSVYLAMGGFIEPSANEKAITLRIRKMNRENPEKLHDVIHNDSIEIDYLCNEIVRKGYVKQQGDSVIWLGKEKNLDHLILNAIHGALTPETLINKIKYDKEFKDKWLDIFSKSLE